MLQETTNQTVNLDKDTSSELKITGVLTGVVTTDSEIAKTIKNPIVETTNDKLVKTPTKPVPVDVTKQVTTKVATTTKPIVEEPVAFVIAKNNLFSCVIDGVNIGKSKHMDYFSFHHRRHDVKVLNRPIAKFIYIGADGNISNVEDTKYTFLGAIRKERDLKRQAEIALKIAA